MGRISHDLHEKKNVYQFHKEFVSLQSIVSLLQIENVELKNQLRIGLIEKFEKVDIL